MRLFQKTVEDVLDGLPSQVLSELIAKKLAAEGVNLSARKRKQLADEIMRGEKDTFVVKGWKWWGHRRLTLDLTAEDLQQIEGKFTNFIENRLFDLIEMVTGELSEKILADLKRKWRIESRLQRRELASFEKRLYDRWKVPFEGLRMLLTISRELGDSINQEIRELPGASSRKHLIDALVRAHVRGCQITAEIIWLLEAGFADGAMARWRTLHEFAVVALFVSAHGEDLAERYILHDIIESRRAMRDYILCQGRLGYEPIGEDEIEAVEASYKNVIGRFGTNFSRGQYGWAAEQLQISEPTFAHIERAVGADHLRAHYRMAIHNVHANAKGVFFKLGLLDESQVLLAGPSNAGLTDPGHGAALSLMQVSAAVGLLEPTVDNIIAVKMIAALTEEIGEAFMRANKRLAEDSQSASEPVVNR